LIFVLIKQQLYIALQNQKINIIDDIDIDTHNKDKR
jgi:hypothetical protein